MYEEDEECGVVDKVLILKRDADLLKAFLNILFRLELIKYGDIPAEKGFTIGMWLARIWRAIENADELLHSKRIKLDANASRPRILR